MSFCDCGARRDYTVNSADVVADRRQGWQPREREMPQSEIVLWTTPKEPPWALLTSVCNEQLDPSRANCMIVAQRQPGKFMSSVSSYPILGSSCARMSLRRSAISLSQAADNHTCFSKGHRHRATQAQRTSPPDWKSRKLILEILGVCRNCRLRNQEITTEVILCEYSRP